MGRKLTDRFIGPFKIEKKISKVAYRLKLPITYKLHPVFHISQLELKRVSEHFPRKEEAMPPPVKSVQTSDSNIWEIEKILGERKRYRRKEYLVKWMGYGSEENSWIPAYNLVNAQELLDEFYAAQKQGASATINDRITETLQCQGKTLIGRRCNRKTKRGPYCWAHMQAKLNLRIKQSSIPQAGLGVFSGKTPIKKGSKIVEYSGDVKPLNGGDYALQVNRRKMIDAAKSQHIGGFINDCRASQRKEKICSGTNTKFVRARNAQAIWVKATKHIKPQKEIFVSYGRQYWRKKAAYDKEREHYAPRPRKRKSIYQRAREIVAKQNKMQLNNFIV